MTDRTLPLVTDEGEEATRWWQNSKRADSLRLVQAGMYISGLRLHDWSNRAVDIWLLEVIRSIGVTW